jgi:hypothetical protein
MFFVPPRFRPDRLRYVLAAIAFAASSPATADLLVNGSFESPLVPVGGFTNFLAGSTSISGWTVVGIDSALVHESFTQSGIVFQAQSGDQYIDLAGVTSNSQSSGVVQSVPTTIGERYVLRFHVGSAQGGGFFVAATIDLRIDGGPRTSYTNPATPSNQLAWQEFTVPFVATNASTQIAFFNGGAANNFNSALDHATLEVAPSVPALDAYGFGLLGAALALAPWVRRMRSRPDTTSA